MTQKYWEKLASDFDTAFHQDNQHDVVITAGEGPEAADFKAHSFVIRSRCSYFSRAFSGKWGKKNNDGYYFLKKPNIPAKVMGVILRYMYSGMVDYDQQTRDVLVRCLIASDELGLEELIKYIQDYLLANPGVLSEDPVGTLKLIYLNESLDGLTDRCLEMISAKPEILFSSEHFPSLDKAIFTLVLQRSDLKMDEVDIWSSLLNWAFVHYLKIGKDHSSFQLVDFQKAEQAIKEHIPFIGFCTIPKEQFYIKVMPYKELLPSDLLERVLKYHKEPQTTPIVGHHRFKSSRVDSILMTRRGFERLTKWINREDGGTTTWTSGSGQFRLLLRGSRDGFSADTFHRLCDNKGATVVLAKVSGSGQLIGGYNPLFWSSTNSYLRTKNSFIFAMKMKNHESARVGYVIAEHYAITDSSNQGPCFGYGMLISPGGNAWSSSAIYNDYVNIDLPKKITVDDYEVFQVLKLE